MGERVGILEEITMISIQKTVSFFSGPFLLFSCLGDGLPHLFVVFSFHT